MTGRNATPAILGEESSSVGLRHRCDPTTETLRSRLLDPDLRTPWINTTRPDMGYTQTPTATKEVPDKRYFQINATESLLDQHYENLTQNNQTLYNGSSESKNGYLMLVEDFSDYFYNNFNSNLTFGENASLQMRSDIYVNCSLNGSLANGSMCDGFAGVKSAVEYNYWALILVLFPFLTLFGNVLVILSVYRERTLQTVTNYFIVSLALADLLVAVVVMPFAVYVLFNGTWGLPPFVCDFYIAMDVICSTSSIFNLVAISIDRYIAVTQPIKYAKHKNNRRVWLTIVLVWVISMAIGSPIVLGLNNTPDRLPDLCLFYNSDFIIYSSLSSFYIPCIMMVFLYYNIFKALRNRARKQRAARKQPLPGEVGAGSVIENVAQTRRLAETALGPTRKPEEERPTNTASGSNEEDDEGGERSPDGDADDCHVISNDKSTELLATVVEETGNAMACLASPAPHNEPNGNNDSGYAPSNLEEPIKEPISSGPNSPHVLVNKVHQQQMQPQPMQQVVVVTANQNKDASFPKSAIRSFANKNGSTSSPRDEKMPLKTASTIVRCAEELTRLGSGNSKKERKATTASRFTIYKVNKASKKKREKSSAKKERKATKTLAIVLGVFLFCWVPFFTCNIMDAMCTKLGWQCQPGVTAFILTTWLGYMNSFVNPVIYTIFNPEFRKAFKKLMHMGT